MEDECWTFIVLFSIGVGLVSKHILHLHRLISIGLNSFFTNLDRTLYNATMKSKRPHERRIRIRDESLHEDFSEIGSTRCGHRKRGLGSLSTILLVAVALGRTSVATAFPNKSRHPLAVAVRTGQRKRPWQESREELEASLWQGFDRQRTTSSTTRLNLFFNTRDENGNIVKKKKRQGKPTAATLQELGSAEISFPKTVKVPNADDVTLTLRHMTNDDLKALVPMCIREFGSGEFNGTNRRRSLLPRWVADPRQIPDVWEGFSFEMLIYWTLKLKLMQGGNSRRPQQKQPRDPVMLVLCESKDSISYPLQDEVVGMVELSLQPPDADRNPPALPLPLWVKAALAKHTTMDGSLQGWVTNLLISDSSRGKGYSKILMAAAEGIAKHQWGCNTVWLHADADFRSGKVPQSLYEGIGYDLVIGSTRKKPAESDTEDPSAKFAWMGVSGKELERFSAIRMIDGVALLCYAKKL